MNRAALSLVLVTLAVLPNAILARADDTYAASINEFLRDRFDRKTGCMVIGLADARETRILAAGKLDNGTEAKADGDSVFLIGSVSKTFTALLLEEMAERGVVKRDDPVAQYLPPGVKMPTFGGKGITLLDLATQASGLPFNPNNMTGGDTKEQYETYTADKMYDFLSGYRLTRDPGAEFGYSNVGIALLGDVLARKAGRSFESLLIERICRPLHMDSTGITLTPELKARLAMAHDQAGQPAPPWNMPAYAPAGAILSTANDLLKYASAHAGIGLSPLAPLLKRTHVIRHEDSRGDPDRPEAGVFGHTAMPWVDRNALQPPGMQLLGHAGGAGGYHAYVGFDMKQHRAVVVLSTDNDVSVEAVGLTLLQHLPLNDESARVFAREQVGIGVALDLDPKTRSPLITKVFPNSPAARAGLTSRMIIKSVDATALDGKTLAESVRLLRGDAGSKARLEVLDTSGKTSIVEVPRERFLVAPASAPGADAGAAYPATRRVDQVDTMHGVRVEDPYRWLEADVRTSPEVADWVAAQNQITAAYLARIPRREAIRRRLTELWNYERSSPPRRIAGRFYVFDHNDGLQNQDVVYTVETPDAEARVLLDPNTWTKDGSAAPAGMAFSPDGKYLAYGIADSGSDGTTWKVLDVATRQPRADELKWIRFSGVSWAADSRGFYYSAYPEPRPGEKDAAPLGRQKAYYHRLGTLQADDVLVYERPDHPSWLVGAFVTRDGRYLVARLSEGGRSRNTGFVYRDLSEPDGKFRDLISPPDAITRFIASDGSVFYFQTDLDAPRGRVIAIDTRRPDRKEWKTVIPEADATLLLAYRVGEGFIGNYLRDAHTELKVFSRDGRFLRELPLPGIGTAGGIQGEPSDPEVYYAYLSFATPPTIFRHDLATGETAPWRQPKRKFDPGAYDVEQFFYRSKDGTRIPLFLTHKKGVKRDGNNPTLLHGYGGFNLSLAPDFDPAWLWWLEQGGFLALANVRGGGEYGREWHRAAIKQDRQKVYDDFTAAALFLIAEKYTRPEKLAIHGSSNGGLLVAACMVQRPDLFRACLPDAGSMDMLRLHKSGAGPYLVSEYGTPENPDEFPALRASSPYHNLKKGVNYPATLMTTADNDERVLPMHSFKFAAALQYCQAGAGPVLLRVEASAGHGAGRSTARQIEEAVDRCAFLVENLGMTVSEQP